MVGESCERLMEPALELHVNKHGVFPALTESERILWKGGTGTILQKGSINQGGTAEAFGPLWD